MQDIKRLLTTTKFGNLWLSQLLSQLTLNIMNFLLLIRVYEITGSTIATSFLWITYAIPAVIVGPFAAVFVDVWDRRRMLIITNLAQAITVSVFAFTYQKFLYMSYAVIGIYSIFNQFYVPAETASLPSLVKKKDLTQANSLFFITQQLALIGGFGIAGIMNELVGYKISFLLCALGLFFAFVSVYALPVVSPLKSKSLAVLELGFLGFFEKIIQGYHFIKDRKSVLITFVSLLSFQVVFSLVVVMIPVLATDIAGVSPKAAGLVIVVPAGIGSGIGSLVISRAFKKGIRKNTVIEFSLKCLTASMIVLSIVVPSLSGSLRYMLNFICFIMIGISGIGLIIPTQTYLQEVTPSDMRGRLFGNFWFLATAASVIPTMLSATAVDLFGINFLMMVISAMFIAVIVFYSRIKKQLIYE